MYVSLVVRDAVLRNNKKINTLKNILRVQIYHETYIYNDEYLNLSVIFLDII